MARIAEQLIKGAIIAEVLVTNEIETRRPSLEVALTILAQITWRTIS